MSIFPGIIDSSGVTVLIAAYDPASDELTALVNAIRQKSVSTDPVLETIDM